MVIDRAIAFQLDFASRPRNKTKRSPFLSSSSFLASSMQPSACQSLTITLFITYADPISQIIAAIDHPPSLPPLQCPLSVHASLGPSVGLWVATVALAARALLPSPLSSSSGSLCIAIDTAAVASEPCRHEIKSSVPPTRVFLQHDVHFSLGSHAPVAASGRSVIAPSP
jgi:hypothetical protein